MAFTIPNYASASFASQAEVDSVDIDAIVAGFARTGVRSGCVVGTATGMQVSVTSGAALIGGVLVTVSAQYVSLTSDPSNARYAIVIVNGAGTAVAVSGTPSSTPAMPLIPAGTVILAAVYIPAGDTVIGTSQITDKRVLIETGGYVQPATIGGPTAEPVFLTLDSLPAASKSVFYQAGGLNRWNLYVSPDSGGAGGDFAVARYSNAGVWQGQPITIYRGTGDIVTESRMMIAGGADYSAALNVTTPNGGTKGFAVRAAAAQSLNLAEFQTSAGTVVASVDPVGSIGSATFVAAGAAGTARLLAFQTGTVGGTALNRWWVSATATAESGSNAGSDLAIIRYTDAGSSLGNVLSITRSNGSTVWDAADYWIRRRNGINGQTAGTVALYLDGNSGQNRQIGLMSAGLLRWTIQANSVVEGGSNAGSNFVLSRFADNGSTLLGQPLTIGRSDGSIALGESGAKIGFLGATAVVRPTVSAAATDAATTQTLVNSLRSALIALGLAA